MDDLISRQAILESVERISVKGNVLDDDWIYRFIQEFPSVEPDSKETSSTHKALDTISRQKAIEAIRASTSKYTGFMEMEMYTDDDAVEAIEALPSAQPEIIRCRDCAKREYCRTSTVWAVAPNDDWYCADAERKEA